MLFYYFPLILLFKIDFFCYAIFSIQIFFLTKIILSKKNKPLKRVIKKNIKLGIVIPVYNEEKKLKIFL